MLVKGRWSIASDIDRIVFIVRGASSTQEIRTASRHGLDDEGALQMI